MAAAVDSKSTGVKSVRVRVPFEVLIIFIYEKYMVYDIESGLPSFFVRGQKLKDICINNPNRLTLVEREEFYLNERKLMLEEYDEYLLDRLEEYLYDIGRSLYLMSYSIENIKYKFCMFLDKFRCQEEYISGFEYIIENSSSNNDRWLLTIFDNPPFQIKRALKFIIFFDGDTLKIDRME